MNSIVLAYDGSIHGDWVGRYAIRLARASGVGMEVLHVDDGVLGADALEARFAHLRDVASASGVEVSLRHLERPDASVARSLDSAVPDEGGRILVAGLRGRMSSRGLLHGTVSQELLRSRRHDVLAIRVVSPSLLGHARHVLLCLSQHPRAAGRSAPFLRLLAPELTRLSLVTVMSPTLGRLARPTAADIRSLRAHGLDHLHRAEAQLRGALAAFEVPFDPHVSVSGEWPAEVVRHAGRARAELILLGWTQRAATTRLVFGNPLERVLRHSVCDVAVFSRRRSAQT